MENELTKTMLASGLYDADDNLVASWDTLVNTYGMGVEKGYASSNYKTNKASPYYVLTNNSTLASGVNLIIDSSVTSIGSYAFCNCSSLTSVVIGDSVTSIGERAFKQCTSLTSVEIPDGVTNIYSEAFCFCSSLTSIKYRGTWSQWRAISKDTFWNYDTGDYIITYNYGIPVGNDGLIYILRDDDTYSVDGYTGTTAYVVIPSIYNGKTVTSIGGGAFYGCSNLTSIEIPDSVTSIGIYAFYKCTSLTSIVIPDGVTSIGNNAFYNCTSLTSIVIPDSVTSIGTTAFYNCTSLTSIKVDANNLSYKDIDGSLYTKDGSTLVQYAIGKTDTGFTIPDGVTSIGIYAFYKCTSLTSIVIPDSVTSIGNNAFYNCTSLTSIVIPDSVTSIGTTAFYNCTSLTDVYYIGNDGQWATITIGLLNESLIGATIHFKMFAKLKIGGVVYSSGGKGFKRLTTIVPFTVTSSNRGMIGYTNSTTSLTIPETFEDQDGTAYEVVAIGKDAFSGCTNLTSVVIPDSVTSIGIEAFKQCTNLTSVVIGDSVTSIGSSAFYNCYKLVEVINKSSLNIVAGSSDYGIVAYYAKEVHNGESKIVNKDGCLFYTYDDINYLIGYAGNNTDLILPDNYNGESYEIHKYAFYNCTNLTSIVIGDSVTSIGERAFYNCTSLTSVVIGDSVTSIGSAAFYGCTNRTSIYINDIAVWCNISFSGNTANPMYYGANLYLNGELLKVLNIPNSITSIGSYAFYGCSSLTSITYNEETKLTQIGGSAFKNCTSLAVANIPGTVKVVHSFSGCTNLRVVELGDGVTTIDWYAFENCSSLLYITIPVSVTTIEQYAFDGCDKLDTIFYKGSMIQWLQIARLDSKVHYFDDLTIYYNSN